MQKTTAQLLANSEFIQFESDKILKRLSSTLKTQAKDSWSALQPRLQQHLPTLLQLYLTLYGNQYDCYFHLEQLLKQLAKNAAQRPAYLRQQDQQPQGAETEIHTFHYPATGI